MDVAVARRARLHWLPRERPELALKLPLRCERRWSQSQSSPFVATAATLHGNRRLRLARNSYGGSGTLAHGVINRLKPMRGLGESHSDAIKHTPRAWRRGLPAAPKMLDRLIRCLIV